MNCHLPRISGNANDINKNKKPKKQKKQNTKTDAPRYRKIPCTNISIYHNSGSFMEYCYADRILSNTHRFTVWLHRPCNKEPTS